MGMTEAIGERLQYFQELESATRMLNHPGESLVLQVDFLYMAERVDLCIEYFKHHVRNLPLVLVRVFILAPTEEFQRVGFVSPALPAMHDASDDPYQDVLRRIGQSPYDRHISEAFRKGCFRDGPAPLTLHEVHVRVDTTYPLAWRIRTKGPETSGRTFRVVGRMSFGVFCRTEEFAREPANK